MTDAVTPPATPASPASGRDTPDATAPARIAYQPGLDGLRGLHLLAIFLTHADLGWAPGGFLAVSTFFTLSGFLITSLLLVEYATTARIDLRAFWVRRIRRLMPAAVLAVTLISIGTAWLGTAGQVERLGTDALAALAYVANWRFIAIGDRYGAGFEGEPTLLHFWSLAIEEQFYVLFPLLCTVVFAWARRWRPATAVVFIAGIVASIAVGARGSYAGSSVDRLYFGTDVRAAEILVGALLAWWWVPRRGHVDDRVHARLRWAGPAGVLLMVALVLTAHSRDPVWYRGGLAAYAVVTAMVVLAAVESHGLTRSFLSWEPLRLLGLVSYGAYLVHWPLFMWLRTQTTVSGATRFLLGTALSVLIAAVSYRAIERPIRERRRYGNWVLAGAGVSLVLVTLLAAGVIGPEAGMARGALALGEVRQAYAYSVGKSMAGPGEAPTVAVYGDSTAVMTSVGLTLWDDTHTDVRTIEGWAEMGCSINSPTMIRYDQHVMPTPAVCSGWLEGWRSVLSSEPADIAYVQFGPWEVYELRPSGQPDFLLIGNPVLDQAIERHLRDGLEAILPHSHVVVVATSPYIDRGRLDGRSPARRADESDPARMDHLNDIIRRVARSYARVAVVELGEFMAARTDDAQLRPDGVHLSVEGALAVCEALAPTLASLAPRADPALAQRPGLLRVSQRPTPPAR